MSVVSAKCYMTLTVQIDIYNDKRDMLDMFGNE